MSMPITALAPSTPMAPAGSSTPASDSTAPSFAAVLAASPAVADAAAPASTETKLGQGAKDTAPQIDPFTAAALANLLVTPAPIATPTTVVPAAGRPTDTQLAAGPVAAGGPPAAAPAAAPGTTIATAGPGTTGATPAGTAGAQAPIAPPAVPPAVLTPTTDAGPSEPSAPPIPVTPPTTLPSGEPTDALPTGTPPVNPGTVPGPKAADAKTPDTSTSDAPASVSSASVSAASASSAPVSVASDTAALAAASAATTSAATSSTVAATVAQLAMAPSVTQAAAVQIGTPVNAQGAALSTAPEPVHHQVASALLNLRASGDGTTNVVVALHPAELGQVNVHVRLANGAMTVQLASGSDATLSTIRAALPDLHQELRNAGLPNVNVSLDQPTSNAAGQQDRRGSAEQRAPTAQPGDSWSTTADTPTRPNGSSRQRTSAGLDRLL